VVSGGTARSRALQGAWGRTWLLALALGIAVVGAAEAHWRAMRLRPSVLDTQGLWCVHRDTATADSQVIAVLGGSRAVEGFAVPSFKVEYDNYKISNMALAGLGPMACLRDLAYDPKFNGIAMVDADTDWLFSKSLSDQQPIVDYYRNVWCNQIKTEQILRTCLQSTFSVLRDDVGLRNILRGAASRAGYQTVGADRWRMTDFSRTDVKERRRQRVAKLIRSMLPPQTSPSSLASWHRDVADIDRWVGMIQARGGKVAFVPFVRTDETRATDERTYPRKLYWDYFAAHTSAVCIHYLDVPVLRSFNCPDTSHLDYRDAPRYTLALAAELEKRGVIRR
jgi:hypothetical protein